MKDENQVLEQLLKKILDRYKKLRSRPIQEKLVCDDELDYDEIVEVIGKGDWKRAEFVIMMAWMRLAGGQKIIFETEVSETKTRGAKMPKEGERKERVAAVRPEISRARDGIAVTRTVEPMVPEATKPMVSEVAKPVKLMDGASRPSGQRSGRRAYTKEELVVALRKVQKYYRMSEAGIPSQRQFKEAASDIKTPAEATFIRGLGPKTGWPELLMKSRSNT